MSAAARLVLLGDPMARLLSGPAGDEPEALASHQARLGPLPPLAGSDVIGCAEAAHLVGRGGGEFPLARKLRAAASASRRALVVVNGSESEPASRKDRVLLERRPHLVLDGAVLAAAAVGADQVVVYVHAGRDTTVASVAAAIRERYTFAPTSAGGVVASGEPRIVVTTAPGGFVAGESSAVVSALSGGDPLPRPRAVPAAVSGVHGRPTVVANAETLAHLALLARFGSDWFRTAGSAAAPGSTLLTLAGGVATPGLVVESLGGATFGDLLTSFGGLRRRPAGILVGGYGGRWVSGAAAWHVPLDRALLRRSEVGLGCGLVAPLPDSACGLEVTAALLDYLAGQSAGQCGACLFGLPKLAEGMRLIVEGDATGGDVKRLREAALTVAGRGGCAHPDGAGTLLETALQVFADDVRHHLRRGHCGAGVNGWFPLPSRHFAEASSLGARVAVR